MLRSKALRCAPVRTAILAALVGMCVVLFCSCGSTGNDNAVPPAAHPVTVYNDGVYVVECVSLTAADAGDGSEMITVTLRFANNSTDSLALSSVLDIRVSADGQPCELHPIPSGGTPLDGLIDAGCTREGDILMRAPVGADCFTVEMAVDHLADQRISFTISR